MASNLIRDFDQAMPAHSSSRRRGLEVAFESPLRFSGLRYHLAIPHPSLSKDRFWVTPPDHFVLARQYVKERSGHCLRGGPRSL